ncbi:acetyltransferase [Aeromonas salmonicida]|uniref:GNAT family acetyltransferase n=1 Tax=Aeromonas salmonicida subsp. pectinolytica 34mel TaxID=1324960 RepID=T0QWL1_AERSA|nr:acetyltransferase [Aeromonas salmonicida]ATP09525.1 GNAT family acetyltransferase [Aeromonas salmonicida subsp. pectinolytica 34mel]EQC05949.1 acetyltransferase [Aeromonas salmonicida subsp. pectinolytica 34mel]TNI19864.1 acetyltransferase [Aeromonas salmonicida]HEH9393737.1 acetyltransferase [Aeromonas salmonicida]
MKIEQAKTRDHPTLISLWEASVRATHHFLPEAEIDVLKPLILEHYFAAVDLVCARDETGIAGFCGVHDGNIEMLFLAPEARGRGIGRLLVAHAISRQGATRVDVNEQNAQALGFYQRMGFVVTGRSPLDGQGKPYPLLHMVLADFEKV